MNTFIDEIKVTNDAINHLIKDVFGNQGTQFVKIV